MSKCPLFVFVLQLTSSRRLQLVDKINAEIIKRLELLVPVCTCNLARAHLIGNQYATEVLQRYLLQQCKCIIIIIVIVIMYIPFAH